MWSGGRCSPTIEQVLRIRFGTVTVKNCTQKEMTAADVDDVINLSDNEEPIVCEAGGVKIILRRIKQADFKELHRLMLEVPWNTLLDDVEDCYAVRQDCQFGAFLLDEPHKMICKPSRITL